MSPPILTRRPQTPCVRGLRFGGRFCPAHPGPCPSGPTPLSFPVCAFRWPPFRGCQGSVFPVHNDDSFPSVLHISIHVSPYTTNLSPIARPSLKPSTCTQILWMRGRNGSLRHDFPSVLPPTSVSHHQSLPNISSIPQ